MFSSYCLEYFVSTAIDKQRTLQQTFHDEKQAGLAWCQGEPEPGTAQSTRMFFVSKHFRGRMVTGKTPMICSSRKQANRSWID